MGGQRARARRRTQFAITSLSGDADNVYATGYTFGRAATSKGRSPPAGTRPDHLAGGLPRRHLSAIRPGTPSTRWATPTTAATSAATRKPNPGASNAASHSARAAHRYPGADPLTATPTGSRTSLPSPLLNWFPAHRHRHVHRPSQGPGPSPATGSTWSRRRIHHRQRHTPAGPGPVRRPDIAPERRRSPRTGRHGDRSMTARARYGNYRCLCASAGPPTTTGTTSGSATGSTATAT